MGITFDEINKLEFGAKVFRVYSKLNLDEHSKSRLEMVDDEGNVWHRYAEPSSHAYIGEYTYVGKVLRLGYGEFDAADLYDTFVFKHKDDKIEIFTDDAYSADITDEMFLDKGEAEKEYNELLRKFSE